MPQVRSLILLSNERAVLRDAVARLGESYVLTVLGFSRATLGRLVAGFPVRRATLFAARAQLHLLAGSGGPS